MIAKQILQPAHSIQAAQDALNFRGFIGGDCSKGNVAVRSPPPRLDREPHKSFDKRLDKATMCYHGSLKSELLRYKRLKLPSLAYVRALSRSGSFDNNN